ncbi:MAG: tetratricopeptide repeat protein [Polyangiales bacterium]
MRRAAFALMVLAGAGFATPVHAWELFKSESDSVAEGNAHLAKKQFQEALDAYDRAARELPDDPGVQLDRGLALLGLGKFGDAREAFRRGAQGNAPPEVRGPSLYNLGGTFMQEAQQAAEAEDFDGANKLLTEGIDALKGALRAQPGSAEAAWNLEIAKRRLVDVQKKQEEKKKQEEEEKKKQPPQDGGTPQPGDGGSPNQGDGGDDQKQPDPGDQGDGGQKPDEPDEPDAGAGEPDAGDAGGTPPPQPGEEDASAPSEPPPAEPQKGDKAMPEHMQRALDALEANEENLEKQRARQRARSQRRRIEKDW